jgi:hypothetical protein
MKTRLGFVSNSSSSSFVCCVCGEIESERDCSLADMDMNECEHSHVFHNHCVEGYLKRALEPLNDEDQIKEDFCPVCQLLVLTNEDELKWWRNQGTLYSQKQILANIKEKYGSYEAFERENTVKG